MNTLKSVLLQDFKKANAAAKEKMAKKFGFKTAKRFLHFLENAEEVIEAEKPKELVDYVIAFDTTGSMSSYIGDVKKHVKELIPDLFDSEGDLMMKIVAFGDYCDMPSQDKFGKAYQETPLTANQNDLIKFITNAENTGGGDGDEFYELVIKKIVEETPWREGSKRVVLFIGDSSPHGVGYNYTAHGEGHTVQNNQIDWKKEAKEAAKLNIAFDTLRIHVRTGWYEELSALTNGAALNFKSSEKTAKVVAATYYTRGSEEKFRTASFAATASGDSELIGVYKTLNTLKEKSK